MTRRSCIGLVSGVALAMLSCGDSSSSNTAYIPAAETATPTEAPTSTPAPTASAPPTATASATPIPSATTTPSATPSTTPTPTPTAVDVAAKMSAAAEAFWDTLYRDAGRYDEVIGLVREVQAADPTNVLAYWWEAAMLAMSNAHAWDGRLVTIRNPSALAVEQLARAQSATETALALATEQGIDIPILPVWPGLTTFLHGFAKSDPEILELGVQRLREGVANAPLLGPLIFAATAGQLLDRDDPLFAEAVDVTERGIAVGLKTNCIETYPRVCADAGAAPHGAEGAFLIYGDVFAKAGRADEASFAYGLSKSFGEKTAWRHLPVVNDRLATLADRVALYADDDRDNDPPFGVPNQTCGMCHFAP